MVESCSDRRTPGDHGSGPVETARGACPLAGGKAELGITIHHHCESGGQGNCFELWPWVPAFAATTVNVNGRTSCPKLHASTRAIRAVAAGGPIFVTFWN
jgi:hypothetical protein